MKSLLEELYKKHKLICEDQEEELDIPPKEFEDEELPKEPGDKESKDLEVPPVGKLYLGNKDDMNYYIDVVSSEDGVVEDIIVYDQEENQVSSAKDQEGVDVSDVKSAIINIVKDLELLTISVDVLFKYDLLGLEEEEPKEEDEELGTPPEEEPEEEVEEAKKKSKDKNKSGKVASTPKAIGKAAVIEALKDVLELGDKSADFIAGKIIEKLGMKESTPVVEDKYVVEFTTTDGKKDQAVLDDVKDIHEALDIVMKYDNFASIISAKRTVEESRVIEAKNFVKISCSSPDGWEGVIVVSKESAKQVQKTVKALGGKVVKTEAVASGKQDAKTIEGKIPNPNDTIEQKIKKLIEKHGLKKEVKENVSRENVEDLKGMLVNKIRSVKPGDEIGYAKVVQQFMVDNNLSYDDLWSITHTEEKWTSEE